MENKRDRKDSVTSSQAEFWAIVNFRESDPGCEFEIIHESQIHGNSWVTLDRGSEITTKFGNAKAQGEIVMISDDVQYLQDNFQTFTEDYISAVDRRTPILADTATKSSHLSTKRKRSDSYTTQTIPKTIIKVCDRHTQTDLSAEDTELINKHELLQSKYDKLFKVFEGLRDNFKRATTAVHVLEYSGDKTSPSTPIIRKPKLENGLKEQAESSNGHNKRDFRKINAMKKELYDEVDEDNDMVLIGYNKTPVPKHIYSELNWSSYTGATRKLLMTLFPRTTLATHSLTGKPSHAFHGMEKQRKMKLDSTKINDVVDVVSRKCFVSESLVRSAITTKCADENKMFKKRLQKKMEEEKESNKENVPECSTPSKKQKLH